MIPILSDAGLAHGPFGQALIAAASVADVASIILLSVVFSRGDGGPAEALVLFGLDAAARQARRDPGALGQRAPHGWGVARRAWRL